MGYVYLLTDNMGNYKIGVTKNIKKRIKSLQTGNGNKIELVTEYKSEHYRKIETIMHKRFSLTRLEGEWFQLERSDIRNFASECRYIDDNLRLLREHHNPFIK